MASSRKIKFAIVGCGSIGTRHLTHVAAHPDAELESFCDSNEQARAQCAASYPRATAYASFEQQLAESGADVFAICTPHHLHADMAVAVAGARKHALVEKPLAITSADAHRMVHAAEANGVELFVVKQNRFNVPVALTQEALLSGRLGRVYMVQTNILWNRGADYYRRSPWRGRVREEGGALFTQASHFIDLLIWWFGDVTAVRGAMATKAHDIEIEDCGVAQVDFSSGVLGTINWTTCVYGKNLEGSITIIGEHGTIRIGGQYLNTLDHWNVKDTPAPPDAIFVDRPNDYGVYQGSSSNHDKVIASVVEHLLHGQGPVVYGHEGVKTVEAIELIYRALARV